MHLLILEYVTAGGLGPAAEQPLCAEADAMALALARDFGGLQGVTVALPRCPTLPWPGTLPASVQRLPGLAQEAFVDLVARHDAVLLVAPETAHILHALALQVESLGRPLLGPSAAAIACAGDKWRCFLALDAAGVPQLPTFPAASDWPDLAGPWVLKPADGCGCEGVRRFPDRATARAAAGRLTAAAGSDGSGGIEGSDDAATPAWLAQPWQAGVAASLTLLSGPSTVELLAVNRQRIQVDELGQVSLAEVETGTLTDSDGRLAALARRVHAAIPGLHGIWGIDVLLQADRDCVVEVNPRITSAYPGLAAVLQDNPARRWLAAAEHLPAAMRDPAAAIGMRTGAAALSPRPAGSPAPAAVLGWDIGGAHLKVAALDRHGRLIDVVQLPCALWQGLDRLEPLLAELCGRWGAPQRHALT
ncbi:MAG: ATP-grasp domain-containing protein, partial [Pseudomonadota bacterium]|nr:ATP-grasp domain-containing protein [Pseudomonadota bacterium]